ncbi:hypothetical protein DCC85_08430 [Paenibacillus sp. CAA11]|uniref:hypothetical protein n=1 Tax=Paenibacillus sp. CAA11 TaxID=1532905 RepID=UPI000D3D239A|nr:hypothetical protein [Paenibacillus sp. CAA11]AWB44239.1 hypothetical protein DCC85_08430 [Paenibacillus sp. CAA11]
MKEKHSFRSLISLALLLVFSTALLLPGGQAYGKSSSQSSAKTYTVKLVSAELTSNDHVGNEWAWSASVDGKSLDVGDSITLKNAKNSIILKSYAVEQDKIPDEGSAEKSISLKSLSSNKTTVKLTVTVTENRGRYSGNKAVWVFTYQISKK